MGEAGDDAWGAWQARLARVLETSATLLGCLATPTEMERGQKVLQDWYANLQELISCVEDWQRSEASRASCTTVLPALRCGAARV